MEGTTTEKASNVYRDSVERKGVLTLIDLNSCRDSHKLLLTKILKLR